jgi:hypothetical protein
MSRRTTTWRGKVAAAGTALVAAVVLPLQAGAAHAATPDEDLVACDSAALATFTASMGSGSDFDLSAAIDDCVNTYLSEMGFDQGAASAAVSGDDGSVNTGILGTVDGSTDSGTSTDSASTP